MTAMRLTQRQLVFGIYWGDKGGLNPGLNVWWRGRYIWPLERKKGKRTVAPKLPFEKGGEGEGNIRDDAEAQVAQDSVGSEDLRS